MIAGVCSQSPLRVFVWLFWAAAVLNAAVAEVPADPGSKDEQTLLAALAGTPAAEATARINALEALGDHHFIYSNYPRALGFFVESKQVAVAANLREARVRADKNIGITQRLMGQFDASLITLEQAAREAVEIGNPALTVSILGNLGSLYLRLGALKLAEEIYLEALNVIGPDMLTERRDILLRLGELYIEAGSYPDAVKSIEEAARVLADMQDVDPLDEAWTRTILSSAQLLSGQTAAAIANLEFAAERYRDHDLVDPWLFRILDLAQAWEPIDAEKSRRYYEQIINDHAGHELMWQALAGLARLREASLDYRLAMDFYERSLASYARANKDLFSRAERVGLHRQLGREVGGYVALLALRNEPEDITRALRLADIFNEQQWLDWSGALAPEFSSSVAVIQQQLADPAISGESRRQLEGRLERAEIELQQAISESDTLWMPVFELADIQTSLGTDEILLQYHCAGGHLLVVAVRSDRTTHQLLNRDCRELGVQANNVRSLLERDASDLFVYPVQLLFDALVRPIEQELADIDHVIVVESDLTRPLPLGVLHDRNRYLIEKHSVSYVASIATFIHSRAERAPTTNAAPILFFGLPEVRGSDGRSAIASIYTELGGALGDLPGVVDESRVAARHAPRGSQILLGDDATEADFRTRHQSDYSIVHFATHGLMSARRAERSALVLARSESGAEDGFLQAWEIARQRLNASLVILSGCRTATVPDRPEFGVLGLPGAFVAAGARAVLGTLWNINDDAPAGLMDQFYGGLARGLPVRSAIQSAANAMLNDPATAHPRYWASFVLVGDGRDHIELRQPIGMQRLLGVGMLVVGLAIWGLLINRRGVGL